MMKELEKQKRIVQEAMETVRIVNDMESRYQLSLEILRLRKLEYIPENIILEIRKRYELHTTVWVLAELELRKEEKDTLEQNFDMSS